MMLWCENCKKAVEPIEEKEYDIPDANVEGYEVITHYCCPDCNSELYQEPSKCVMCGEYTSPDNDICSSCSDSINEFVDGLGLVRNNVLEGLSAYLEMEGM